MQILVIGGSGFIGTRLVENLLIRKNCTVRIFDKIKSTSYPDLSIVGDVRDYKAVELALSGVDVVYNLAAEHADNVFPQSLYKDVNIGGAQNIVKAAEITGVNRIVFTSTVAIYGLNKGEPDETSEAAPFNAYGSSKWESELVLREWVNKDANNRSLTIVRPSVVFGEKNRGNVYNLLKQVASGKFIMIGNGNNRKSMGYVGNVSSFLAFCSDYGSGMKVFNYADKDDLTSGQIVSFAQSELGVSSTKLKIPYVIGLIGGYAFDLLSFLTRKRLPISSVRVKKFCANTTVNASAAKETGFEAPFTLEEGLKRMVESEFKNSN